MTAYSFTTSFSINSPVQEVWKTLLDYEQWEQWWRGVRDMKVGPHKDTPALSLSIGFPLYVLHLKLQITNVEIGKVIRFTSSGDLIGDGMFVLKSTDDTTEVSFDWNVKTPKPWMNIVATVAKPVFELSHNLVMSWFVTGLAKRLQTTITHARYTVNNPTQTNVQVAPVLHKK